MTAAARDAGAASLPDRVVAAVRAALPDPGEGVRLLTSGPGAEVNHWLTTLILDRPDMDMRDRLLAALNGAGFMARPLWTLMHRLPMYAACPRNALPAAEALEASVINIPSSARLANA